MEYAVDNRYYKLGVLATKIPNLENASYGQLYLRVTGKTNHSVPIREIFRHLSSELENNEAMLKELEILLKEFADNSELELYMQVGEHKTAGKKHISQADDEMFTRGILAKK